MGEKSRFKGKPELLYILETEGRKKLKFGEESFCKCQFFYVWLPFQPPMIIKKSLVGSFY